MRLVERLLNRAAREAVTRLGVPPRWTGYRYLPRRSAREFSFLQLEPPGESVVPLPSNIASREQLSRATEIWGTSFHDVPCRPLRETYLATLPNCRVFTATNEWGVPFYALTGDGPSLLETRGVVYRAELHRPLLRNRPQNGIRLKKAVWILEQWDRNYAHWVQWHLPKLALMAKHRPDVPILLPSGSTLGSVVARSVELLGIRNVIELPAEVFDVEELTVIGMDDYRPSILEDLRRRLLPRLLGRASRKIFITRAKRNWRNLANEDEIWPLLEARGYERVFMENYSFDDQIALMSDAAVIFALHGAGLANMLFAPTGTHVIEVSDVAFPNAAYYALAGALRHRYWLLRGEPASEWNPGYHWVRADASQVREVLDEVDRSLAAEERTREDQLRDEPFQV